MNSVRYEPVELNLRNIIGYMEQTPEDSWCTEVVRSGDGGKNCFFGHLHAMYEPQGALTAARAWNKFEEEFSTTYYVYEINDGRNPSYPQATAKERILAFLENLDNGAELKTPDAMEAEYQQWIKRNS